ncbi:alpha-(1,3)-fucosyltransferase C [Eurytemora carolleeae]|uniref:alpha-(1,3)-fucosyltransferase C n=1 Tax=Eurytemora carolleeae TaxID=1294199 RepID=UPI000C771078|nr:alpha-(1,3)-fucosyltransferase C [Eurytemora carolleeae]|eukprot:XP_023320067.1 alpha-(1,3)-fucosyltransferase C-like [Eurytemora affinis]
MQRRHWVRLSRHLWPFFLVFLISLSFLLSFHGDTDPQKYSIHETSQNKLEYRALDEESRNMDLIISGDSLTTRESLPGEKIPDIDIKHESGDNDLDSSKSSNFKVSKELVINNFGDNIDLIMEKDRQRDSDEKDLKYILHWNEAYGGKEYDIGFGREPFYSSLCPETRCVTTQDRSLKNLEDFDAIVFHQRSLDWTDIPEREKRRPLQRYVHFIMESAQYLYMDIAPMNNFFNWTMTYRRDSDFYRPYGRVVKIKDHPEGDELDRYIKEFGENNKHLAEGKNKSAAWFVSHCATQARRELYAKKLNKHMDVDIYGKCGKFKCPRTNEDKCYKDMAKNYKFYLSFENSVCEDYITEKFYRILKYNVIPVTYNGVDMDTFAPYHSYINTLDFKGVSVLAQYLQKVSEDPALYASYFWWKDFYEVRDRKEDLNQAFCSLCSALHVNKEEKVYSNLDNWWINQSRCRKLKLV